MTRFASPLEGKTTNWRAGCGRSACPVRREGGRVTVPPYPYRRGSLSPPLAGIALAMTVIKCLIYMLTYQFGTAICLIYRA